MSATLGLPDYRRRVQLIYLTARSADPTETTWLAWRRSRDELFKTHSQTPIEDPDSFVGLPFFDFDPEARVVGTVHETEPAPWGEFDRIGMVTFKLWGADLELPIYWLRAYGGGLFLPFGDATNSKETYGGGRYLLDTVKGADLGQRGSDLILDFNYAYHPSCTHSARWVCPLAEPDGRLPTRIEAGERLSEGPSSP